MIGTVVRATLGTLRIRRGRILILGLLLAACGGRAQRSDPDSSTGGGPAGGDAATGTSGKADPGTMPGEGGATGEGVGGTAGMTGSSSNAGGAPVDTTTSVGDLDHPPPELGS